MADPGPNDAAPESDVGDTRVFWILFAVAAAVAVAPLCLASYLPMIDLPQHTAQLAIGKGWDNPSNHYQETYQFNWFVNHIIPRLLVMLFGTFLSLQAAMKVVVGLALVGLPASVVWLLHRLRSDLYWSLPTFVVGFGFSFCWGFFDFVFAVPLGVLLIVAGYDYATQPSRRRALALAGLALLCFLSHILVLGAAAAVAASLVVAGRLTLRQRLAGLGALASVAALALAFSLAARRFAVPSSHHIPLATAYGLQRFHELLTFQVGLVDPDGHRAALGALLLALPFVMGARPSRQWFRWVPVAVALLMFFWMPHDMFSVAFLHGRYAVFVLPTLLIALEPARSARRALRWLAFAVVIACLGLNGVDLLSFDAEARGLDPVLGQMRAHRRVMYLATDPSSDFVPYPAYVHFGSYYQVTRGGPVDFSFADFFGTRYRYRPEAEPHLPGGVEWAPGRFRWARHDGYRYDYLLVRGPVLPIWFVGMPAGVSYRLVVSRGPWHLLERADTRSLLP